MPTDIVDPAGPEQLISAWLARQLEENPLTAAVERDPDVRRWYLRLHGEERDFTTIWLTLGQRTLRYETYFMPAPGRNREALYEYLLRRNPALFALRFSIGAEDAIYLTGQMPLGAVDEAELDRIVGSTYAAVEAHFRPAMRIAFPQRPSAGQPGGI